MNLKLWICKLRGHHAWKATGVGLHLDESTCRICGKRVYSPRNWLDLFDDGRRVIRKFGTSKPYFESLKVGKK